MSGTVKGIVVEIGGDTSGLQKALSNVNSITANLGKELRGINTLLKFDPQNTELLNQKQTVLTNTIKETENKLKVLKQTQIDIDKAIQNGTEISEENYRALQREVINTENKLKALKVEASNWTLAGNKLNEYGSKLENFGNKIDSVGNKMTTALTLPIIGLATVVTKSAMEQESAIQQVERIYGNASGTIKDFAENTAISYNMSTSDAYKYSQIYGNLIQTITNDQNENAESTQKLLKASSVIASATGRTMEDVMDRIRSGLLGNTEAIEDLGVNVNVALLQTTDAFNLIANNRSWNQLTFQEQQQIRLMGILEQTSKKYGDEVNINTASSLQQLTAKTKNMSTKLGDSLLPILNKIIDKCDSWIDSFNDLSEEEQENIVKIGLMVAAAGPLIKIFGTLTSTTGTVITGLGNTAKAIANVKNGVTTATGTVGTLTKVFSTLANPIGLACVAIATSITGIIIAVNKANEEVKNKFSAMGKSASDFYTGIQSATGYLEKFNDTIFASSEEQQNLKTQMDEIQTGITEICKTASDERRGYTQEEITQLDEYFSELRDLEQRELEIEQYKAEAIVQSAKIESTTFNGSLEEYKIRAQEWIATAQQQANKQIEIAESNRINTLALLNSQYSEEERLTNENYLSKVAQAESDYQLAVTTANKQIGDISTIYTQGYTNRENTENTFYEKLKEYSERQENLLTGHNEKIRQIKDGELWYVTNNAQAISSENETFAFHQGEIWNELYKNMSISEAEQLGSWLGMLANTEMYGGNISDENQKMVDTILASYDTMPDDTKEAMKNAMSPILDEMETSEPSLFTKATGIAEGILSRLKKSFDIHSPSKKTRQIFRYVGEGEILGLQDTEKDLYKQADSISNNLLQRLNGISTDLNMGDLSEKIIDQTKSVFTTPQMIFNIQKLDESNLNTAFNYVNKRLGSQY